VHVSFLLRRARIPRIQVDHDSFDGGMETMGKMPAYLAETGYKNPDDQADGPLQYRYGAQGEDFFSDTYCQTETTVSLFKLLRRRSCW